MNKITKKLILSVLTVILAVGALGTTTFAWFTLSNVAKVDAFEAHILSEYGIEISLDGDEWVNNLTQEDIKAFRGLSNFRFNHVTTEDGIDFFDIGPDHKLRAEHPTTNLLSNKTYLEFDLYFRSKSVTEILLTEILLSARDFQWEADVSYDAGYGTTMVENTPIWVNAINAFRFAFTYMVDNPLYDDQDPNSEEMIEELIKAYERNDFTGANLATNTSMNYEYDAINGENMAMDYYKRKNNAWPGLSPDGDLVTTTPITLVNDVADLTGIEMALTLTLDSSGYHVGMVTVKVWLEGFDAEAFNSILNEQIIFSLTFKGNLDKPVTP